MCESASHVVAAEVTQAVRDTSTDAGQVHVGDWIGLNAKGVRSVADSIAGAANKLLAGLVTDKHEFDHDHRGRRLDARQYSSHHRVLGRRVFPRSASRCTRAGSPSTRTTSASSE